MADLRHDVTSQSLTNSNIFHILKLLYTELLVAPSILLTESKSDDDFNILIQWHLYKKKKNDIIQKRNSQVISLRLLKSVQLMQIDLNYTALKKFQANLKWNDLGLKRRDFFHLSASWYPHWLLWFLF